MIAAEQSALGLRWRRALTAPVDGTVLASPTLDCNRTQPNTGTGIYYFLTSTGWAVQTF